MTTPITIAPHLQRALDVMSKDMSVAPEALVNQAVFAWLRINGYVLPGQPAQAAAPAPVVAPPGPAVAPVVPPVVPAVTPVAAPVSTPTPVPAAAPEPVVAKAPDRAAALARMAEIDADLEKLAKPWPAWPPEAAEEEAPGEEEEAEAPADDAPPPEEDEAEAEDPSLDANTGETEVAQEEEEDLPVEDRTLAPVAADKDEPVEEEEKEEEEPPAESTIVLKQIPIVLYLQRAGEEPLRVDKERFIIGRGPHCDLIIDSPRVSREHVALTRSGIMYFLEDLNSSNGTWFNEERVTKRELESGDVILLGNEAVTFILRGE